jgi:hypothetical protein
MSSGLPFFAITFAPYFSTFALPSLNICSSCISTNATPLEPSFANEQAIAFPSPLAPPVMKAMPGATGPFRKCDILTVQIE